MKRVKLIEDEPPPPARKNCFLHGGELPCKTCEESRPAFRDLGGGRREVPCPKCKAPSVVRPLLKPNWDGVCPSCRVPFSVTF